MSRFEKREVLFEGIRLGYTEIEVDGPRDWNHEDGLDGHLARTSLYAILREHPKPPKGHEMDPQPWILTVLRQICLVYTGTRQDGFENQVFKRYSRHFGLGQMQSMVEAAQKERASG